MVMANFKRLFFHLTQMQLLDRLPELQLVVPIISLAVHLVPFWLLTLHIPFILLQILPRFQGLVLGEGNWISLIFLRLVETIVLRKQVVWLFLAIFSGLAGIWINKLEGIQDIETLIDIGTEVALRLGASLVHLTILARDSLSLHFLDFPIFEVAVLRNYLVCLQPILFGRVRTHHHVVLAEVPARLLRLGGLL